MNKFSQKILLLVLLVLSPVIMFSEEYNISLGQMPVYAVSEKEGVLIDLVNAMAEETGDKFNIKVLPFASSVYLVKKQMRDFHLPLIKNDLVDENKLPFYYSKETQFHVNFVIYSKKDTNLDLSNLSKYNIETDRAHVEYFPFKTIPSNSIERSLKKVENREIDAFIFADFATDPFVKKEGYKNIKRELYKRFDSKIILAKNEKGKAADLMITNATAKLKASGKFQKIMDKIDLPYNNWQP
ncbi:transporter substrate-binding domain-containing protein [uncultured Arcobacter sp.]|uniref:transporter substrate-binding domain-containing protein n=1 Tax=uncultured Arcobacter sp. TaxID=165434 RepID=UPI00260BAC57|nr:transporter substrate-binding domain-containing protein [uncultured Arcobacter sp.]